MTDPTPEPAGDLEVIESDLAACWARDELRDLLAAMPEADAALVSKHLAVVGRGPHVYRVACEVARILSAGLTPEAFVGLAMRLAAGLERQSDDLAEAGFAAITRHDAASDAAASSAKKRTRRATGRDAEIRAAWAKLTPTMSARSRADVLKRRHGWSRAVIQRALNADASPAKKPAQERGRVGQPLR